MVSQGTEQLPVKRHTFTYTYLETNKMFEGVMPSTPLFHNTSRWRYLESNETTVRNLSKSLISSDVKMPNEKKLECSFSHKQQVTLLRWNQSGSCLTHDPQRKDKICTGSYLVQRTVWAVFGSERAGETATSEAIIWGWDHCLAPSLHAYGPERLSQAAQLAVLSHRCIHFVVQRHFSVFSLAKRTFCPDVGLVIQVIGCLFPVIRNSFWICQLKESHDVCVRRIQLCNTSLMLTSLAAHLL